MWFPPIAKDALEGALRLVVARGKGNSRSFDSVAAATSLRMTAFDWVRSSYKSRCFDSVGMTTFWGAEELGTLGADRFGLGFALRGCMDGLGDFLGAHYLCLEPSIAVQKHESR